VDLLQLALRTYVAALPLTCHLQAGELSRIGVRSAVLPDHFGTCTDGDCGAHTTGYLGSMGATLYAALVMHSYIMSLMCCGIQVH